MNYESEDSSFSDEKNKRDEFEDEKQADKIITIIGITIFVTSFKKLFGSLVKIAAAGNESQKSRRTEATSKIVRESLWKNNNNATNGKKKQ
jgi:hypothetical protein